MLSMTFFGTGTDAVEHLRWLEPACLGLSCRRSLARDGSTPNDASWILAHSAASVGVVQAVEQKVYRKKISASVARSLHGDLNRIVSLACGLMSIYLTTPDTFCPTCPHLRLAYRYSHARHTACGLRS